MKVKIIRCNHGIMWYKDKIGQIFNVKCKHGGYLVTSNTIDDRYDSYYIYPDDCIDIIEYRKEKFERILK